MISEVHKALDSFWNSFGVKAYPAGRVEDHAAFPYITYDIGNSESFSSRTITAICWHQKKSGVNVQEERAELLDLIASSIPCEGKKIALEHGMLILNRNPVDFQTYYDDPEDKSIFGGRTSAECRFYTM